jgi:hypothetical protein
MLNHEIFSSNGIGNEGAENLGKGISNLLNLSSLNLDFS